MMRSAPGSLIFAVGAATCLVPLTTASPAKALTVTGLKDTGALWAAGDYGPGGNCARQPHITLAETGFTFIVNGQAIRPARSEWAPDFMREADGTKAAWFFPFEKSDSDFGPIVMSLMREGRGVTLTLENNATGPQSGAYGALLAASPYKRCGATPAAAAAVPAKKAPPQSPPSAPSMPLEWMNLPQATNGQGSYDMLERGGAIAASLKALLGPKAPVLDNNLSVSGPLTRAGSVYYTSGNAEHRGGYDMAYVLLDAGQRAIEVGLWEGGKLTLYRSGGRRIALPPEIAKMRAEQPPEDAVAAPGPPWELHSVQGHSPLAFGTPAASPHLDTLGLYCDSGRPWISAKFYRDPGAGSVTLTVGLMGRYIDTTLHAVNGTRTMWIGDISQSALVKTMLAYNREPAVLRVNGQQEGEVTMTGIGQTARPALGGCMRF